MDFSFNNADASIVTADGTRIPFDDPKCFKIVSKAWLRVGWDTKYVYSFSWLGRPVIQLPEDMIRIQEVIYSVQPDVIIETGVAHGGSLVFYASLCHSIGKGRVIGIDVEIKPHNRAAIEEHRLKSLITLIENDSTSDSALDSISDHVDKSESVLVILDSNHSKDHVLQELICYAKYVTSGSYIVACDGIMKDVAGAPRSKSDWAWNNPISAIEKFLETNPCFSLEEPLWPFNESTLSQRVTYWPQAFLKRIA
jgi:cephalosporin hydroxylase